MPKLIAEYGKDELVPAHPSNSLTNAFPFEPADEDESYTVEKGDPISQNPTSKRAIPWKGIVSPAAAAAVVAVADAGATLLLGEYDLAYTFVTEQGETGLSPVAELVIADDFKIRFPAIALPTNAIGVNYYGSKVPGSNQLVKYGGNLTGAQTDFNAPPGGGAVAAPTANLSGGSKVLGLNRHTITVDDEGTCWMGKSSVIDTVRSSNHTSPVWVKGQFFKGDCPNLTDEAIKSWGAEIGQDGTIRKI